MCVNLNHNCTKFCQNRMSISEILYDLNFWKNVVISRQLSRTLKCSGAEMNSFFFFKSQFLILPIYFQLCLSSRFHAAFFPENCNMLGLFCFFFSRQD